MVISPLNQKDLSKFKYHTCHIFVQQYTEQHCRPHTSDHVIPAPSLRKLLSVFVLKLFRGWIIDFCSIDYDDIIILIIIRNRNPMIRTYKSRKLSPKALILSKQQILLQKSPNKKAGNKTKSERCKTVKK